jgi:hypothetical protein
MLSIRYDDGMVVYMPTTTIPNLGYFTWNVPNNAQLGKYTLYVLPAFNGVFTGWAWQYVSFWVVSANGTTVSV